jgi:hypothetical protein
MLGVERRHEEHAEKRRDAEFVPERRTNFTCSL